jgi:hypothetical protein
MKPFKNHKTVLIQLVLIATFFLALFTLTYRGKFIADDEHILASRSISLAIDGHLNDYRVLGNSRVFDLFNRNGIYGAQGIGIEPAQAYMSIFLVFLAQRMDLGTVHSLFMFNIIISTITVMIFYLLLKELKFTDKTALLTTFLFGSATTIWPFSQTYFRDPLAMLFASLCWLMVVSIKNNRKSHLAIAVLAISFIMAVLSKNTGLLLLPVLVLYGFQTLFKSKKWKSMIWALILLAGLGIITIVIPPDGNFARFSFLYYKEVLIRLTSTGSTAWLPALFGPLISPGKSLFLYSPILLLSIPGLILNKKEGWPGWLYLFLLISAQALFYGQEWAGLTQWGLRNLLPAYPLLMIPAAYTINQLLASRNGIFGLVFIATCSISTQIIGLLHSPQQYYAWVSTAFPDGWQNQMQWNFSNSHLFWNLLTTFKDPDWSFAFMELSTITRLGFIFSTLIILLTAILMLIKSQKIHLAGIVLLGYFFILTVFMHQLKLADKTYFPETPEFIQTVDFLLENTAEEDMWLLAEYNSPLWLHFMNSNKLTHSWITLPYGNSNLKDMMSVIGTYAKDKETDRIWVISSSFPLNTQKSIEILTNTMDIIKEEEWYINGTVLNVSIEKLHYR